MTFGSIVSDFIEPIQSTVKGKVVIDVGAGDLSLSKQLLKLGAKKIIAVDKQLPSKTSVQGIELVPSYFHEFVRTRKRWDVAFISWPVNWEIEGLVPIIHRSETVILLSKNTDGTACGFKHMWQTLARREIEYAIPHIRNWLHIYSGEVDEPRKLTGEEEAALDTMEEYAYWSKLDEPIRRSK